MNLKTLNQFKNKVSNDHFILKNTIHPNYISGLTQADGSFFCVIKINRQKYLQFTPTFVLTTDYDSRFILEDIKNYFQCGKIYNFERNFTSEFRVTDLNDLKNFVIPHFKFYPLFFSKLHAFKLFILIVDLLIESQGKSPHNFDFKFRNKLLVKYALSMNKASQRSQERINKI